MGAGHDHGAPGGHTGRLAVALALSCAVVVVQAVGAVVTGSLALLVDTAHVLVDASGLAVALVAARLVRRPETDRHTWGLRRAEVLAAMGQAALLLAVGGYALVDGVRRLASPPEVAGGALLVFGLVGLAANLVAVGVVAGGRDAGLSMRAAFLEVVSDALGSVAVVVAAVLVTTLGWDRADAVAGIAVALLIAPRTLAILGATTRVLLESTPEGLDLTAVRRHILALPHVVDVHDLHASQIATGLPVLTAHVTMEDRCFESGHAADILGELQDCVAEHFEVSVEHSTFQVEPESHAARERARHG